MKIKQWESAQAGDAHRRAELARRGRTALDILLPIVQLVPAHLPRMMSRPQLFGHGWYAASSRLARASLVLLEAGLDHEAAPLRRSLLEHTTALIWLAESGEVAIDAVQRGHQESVRRLVDSLQGEGWPPVPAETTEMLTATLPTSSEEHLQHVNQRLGAFGLEVLLGPWLTDTAVAHPSLRSASYFWRDHADGTVSPQSTPGRTDSLPTLAGNGHMLLLATLAIDSLIGGVFATEIASAAEALGVEPRLPTREHGTSQP